MPNMGERDGALLEEISQIEVTTSEDEMNLVGQGPLETGETRINERAGNSVRRSAMRNGKAGPSHAKSTSRKTSKGFLTYKA